MKRLKQVANSMPVAPAIAAMFALAAAAVVAFMPHWLFEYYVQRVGLPGLVPAATPPLGDTARIAGAFGVLAGVGALLWPILTFVEKAFLRKPGRAENPVAVASPPAPLRAETELGAPLMSDEAMTQAREELLLDAAMVEAAEVPPLVEAEIVAVPEPVEEAEIVEAEIEPVAEPEPIEPVSAAPVSRLPVAPDNLAGLMNRLDAALLDKPVGWKPEPARMAAR